MSAPVPRILVEYQEDRKSVVTRYKRGSSQYTLAMREKLDTEVARAFSSSGLPTGLKTSFELAYKHTLLGCACAIKRRKLEFYEEWPEMVGVSCRSMVLYIVSERLGGEYNPIIAEIFGDILKPKATIRTADLNEHHIVTDENGEEWEGLFEMFSLGVKNLQAWSNLYALTLNDNDARYLLENIKVEYDLVRLNRKGYQHIFKRLHDTIVRDIETRIGHGVFLSLPKRKTAPLPLVVHALDNKTKLRMNAQMILDLQK